METGERLKGNEPGINTFPHQDGCELGKRLKKGPVNEVMRLKALVPAMRLKATVFTHSPTKTVASLASVLRLAPHTK
jgi:hypothetical protein